MSSNNAFGGVRSSDDNRQGDVRQGDTVVLSFASSSTILSVPCGHHLFWAPFPFVATDNWLY